MTLRHLADRGGDPELLRESQRRRFANVELVDKVLENDEEWRKGARSDGSVPGKSAPVGQQMRIDLRAPRRPAANYAMETAKREFNAINKQIAELKKVRCLQRGGRGSACRSAARRPPLLWSSAPPPAHGPPPSSNARQAKQDASELMEQSKAAKGRIAQLEEDAKAAAAARDAALGSIGNIVHDSVPISKDEARRRPGGRRGGGTGAPCGAGGGCEGGRGTCGRGATTHRPAGPCSWVGARSVRAQRRRPHPKNTHTRPHRTHGPPSRAPGQQRDGARVGRAAAGGGAAQPL